MESSGIDAEPRSELYLPFRQNVFPGMAIVLRPTMEPERFASVLRGAIWDVDSDQPIYDVSTMEQAIARAPSGPSRARR